MDFLNGLLSKKLLVTVAGAIYLFSIGDVNQAVGLIVAYIGGQSAVDITKILKK